MTDGTHRGAILDRDGDKLESARVLLDENKRLVEKAFEITGRVDAMLDEIKVLNAESKREHAERLMGEVDRRQKAESSKSENP